MKIYIKLELKAFSFFSLVTNVQLQFPGDFTLTQKDETSGLLQKVGPKSKFLSKGWNHVCGRIKVLSEEKKFEKYYKRFV